MVALHVMPRFVNFGIQIPEIHAPHFVLKNFALLALTCVFGKLDCFYRDPAGGDPVGIS